MTKKVFIILIILVNSIFTYNCNSDPDPGVFPPVADLPVPFCYQEEPMWCCHACIEMWGLYEGNYAISQNFLANDPLLCDCPYPTCGMYFYQVFSGVNLYAATAGYECMYDLTNFGYDMVLSRVTAGLSVGQPSILFVLRNIFEKHAIIVIGFQKEENENNETTILNIHYHDPWEGGNLEQTYDFFRRFIYEPTCQFEHEEDRAVGYLQCGYWYIVGHGDKTFSELKSDANQGYRSFLKICGNYYGGPAIYIPEGSTFLRVRSPQGNETLAARKTDRIKWESNGLTGQIKLELYKNDSFAGTIATNLPIENGSHDWTVGDYINGSVQTGYDYRIKVSMMDESYDDFSNVDFAIGDVNVTVPNGGENWEQGVIRNITWDSSYFSGNVQLVLTKTIPGTDYLIADNIENTGTYQWQVGMCSHIEEPEAPFGMTLPDDCYKIKVVSVDNPDLKDSSDQVFAVVEPQPVITITSPNGGENWQAGSIGNINWTASGLSENIKITLWQNGLLIGNIATPVDPAPGTYSWTVGQYDGGTAPVGNGYTIKIKEIGTAVADFSDVNFTIKGINITSPNGGESWQTGSSRDITWDAPGVAGSLKITLWRGGVFLGLIAADIAPVPGVYSWTVGQYAGGTAPVGSGYTIKIKEIGTAVSDTGDAGFVLVN